MALAFFISCKKEELIQVQPETTTVTATRDASLGNHDVATPNTSIVINQYVAVVTTDITVDLRDAFDYDFLDLSNLENMRLIISYGPYDSLVIQGGQMGGGTWRTVPLKKGTNSIKTVVDAHNLFFGSLTSHMTILYSNNSIDLLGQKVTFGYGAAPKIETMSIDNSVPIENDVFREIARVRITVPIGKSIAIKGPPAFRNTFADNNTNGNLRYDSLQLYLITASSNENITGDMVINDSLGGSITSLTEGSVPQRKFWFTKSAGNGEIIIPAGQWVEFSVWAVPHGFGPSTDGDATRTINIVDNALPPSSHMYLNKGTVGSQPKLYSSPTATATANTFAQNFVFSFMEAGQEHSGIYGVSSGDWRNSYGLSADLQATISHTRLVTQDRHN